MAALIARRRGRISAAPPRAPWPAQWTFDPSDHPRGQLVYIRRTNEQGAVLALGRRWPVDRHWCHRLVRLELDLARGEFRSYALRRSAPAEQPLLHIQPYELRLS